MRLSDLEKNAIIDLAEKYFGHNVKIYLFGSRVYDEKRGGDIDLYIETHENIDRQTEIKFLANFHKLATERKIDLIVKTPSSKEKSIYETA
ncbi:MAG: nucleotidyltransferase domain-containing protein [bacterium]